MRCVEVSCEGRPTLPPRKKPSTVMIGGSAACSADLELWRKQTSVQMLRAHAVAHLVKAPCYKPEGRGFDSQFCHRNFPLT